MSAEVAADTPSVDTIVNQGQPGEGGGSASVFIGTPEYPDFSHAMKSGEPIESLSGHPAGPHIQPAGPGHFHVGAADESSIIPGRSGDPVDFQNVHVHHIKPAGPGHFHADVVFGASAFVSGSPNAFVSSHADHKIAHEAAHVLQQPAGRHLD